MRNVFIPVITAVAIFIAGVFILNIQLWYSARVDSSSGARYAVNHINAILDEARVAARTATEIIAKGCDADGQYQLGTEAALQPHLRTIVILKKGQPWCSSLPGNRILLLNINDIPFSELLLTPASDTVNGRPVSSAADVAAQFRPGSRLSIDVERGGAKVPISINLEQP